MDIYKTEKALAEIVDIFPALLQSQKDYYDNAIESGFSKEQALYLTGEFMKALFSK